MVPLNPAGYLQKTKSTVLFYTPSRLYVERQKPASRKEKTTHGPTGHHPCGAVGSVWAGAAPRAGATSCLHSADPGPRSRGCSSQGDAQMRTDRQGDTPASFQVSLGGQGCTQVTLSGTLPLPLPPHVPIAMKMRDDPSVPITWNPESGDLSGP